MLFKKAYEEEKINEMVASLESMTDNYLQAYGIKAVSFVRYEGFPIYRIAIYTLNPSNDMIPIVGANVILTYCLDRDIAAEKIYSAAITLEIDNAYKLLASLKLEGY